MENFYFILFLKKKGYCFINLMSRGEGSVVPEEVIKENEGENEKCQSFRPFQVTRRVKISPSSTAPHR